MVVALLVVINQADRAKAYFQGAEISAPICIAPTGFHRLAWPDGEMSTARGVSCPHPEAPLPRPFRRADVSFRSGATSFSMEGA